MLPARPGRKVPSVSLPSEKRAADPESNQEAGDRCQHPSHGEVEAPRAARPVKRKPSDSVFFTNLEKRKDYF